MRYRKWAMAAADPLEAIPVKMALALQPYQALLPDALALALALALLLPLPLLLCQLLREWVSALLPDVLAVAPALALLLRPAASAPAPAPAPPAPSTSALPHGTLVIALTLAAPAPATAAIAVWGSGLLPSTLAVTLHALLLPLPLLLVTPRWAPTPPAFGPTPSLTHLCSPAPWPSPCCCSCVTEVSLTPLRACGRPLSPAPAAPAPAAVA